MKYYRQIKVALIVAFIAVICLWLFGCASFTEKDLPKSQLIKTPVFKSIKTATATFPIQKPFKSNANEVKNKKLRALAS